MLKKFAKVLGLLSVSALFAGSVFATDMAAQKEEMINSLNLTPDQKTKVVEIMNESHTKREEILNKHANQTGAEKIKAMAPELKKLHKETQDKFSKVLDEEQMIKLEQMQDEMFHAARDQAQKNNQVK